MSTGGKHDSVGFTVGLSEMVRTVHGLSERQPDRSALQEKLYICLLKTH